MSPCMEKHFFDLIRLANCSSCSEIKSLLKSRGCPSLFRAISECCLNVLKGVVPLETQQHDALSPYKSQMRQLCARKNSAKRRKHLILGANQIGGGLPFVSLLLAPVLSSIGSTIAEKILKIGQK